MKPMIAVLPGDGIGPEVTKAALRVLEACGGSHSEAARVLGIARNTLWRKLKAYS